MNAEFLQLKSTNQNLYNLLQRLIIIVLVILVASQITVAYLGAFVFLPQNKADKFKSGKPTIRFGFETHKVSQLGFEFKKDDKYDLSSVNIKNSSEAYHGFVNGLFDVVSTDYLTARLLVEKHGGFPLAFENAENDKGPLEERYMLISNSIEGDAWDSWKVFQSTSKKYVKLLDSIATLEMQLKKSGKRENQNLIELREKAKQPLIDRLEITNDLYVKYNDDGEGKFIDSFVFNTAMFIHEYNSGRDYYLVIKTEQGDRTLHFIKEQDETLKLHGIVNNGFKGTSFFSETKGGRLLLTGGFMKVERMVPELYLKDKTGNVDEWFGKQIHRFSGLDGLKFLSDNKVDVVSVIEKDFKKYIHNNPGISQRLKVLWYSTPLARSVIVLRKGFDKSKESFIKRILTRKSNVKWKLFADATDSFEDWEFKLNGRKFMYDESIFALGGMK